jgi:dTDP-4-dehydrorhamnose 3,5-epimerase-like enzyme
MNSTIRDVKLFTLNAIVEQDGNLIPIEIHNDMPMDVKRIFYVWGVRNQNDRGCHAHYKTEQVLICLSGKIECLCDDGINKKRFLLESPQQALYIPTMIWDEQKYLTEDSVLLVLSNTLYDKTDYIENYEEFINIKLEYNYD